MKVQDVAIRPAPSFAFHSKENRLPENPGGLLTAFSLLLPKLAMSADNLSEIKPKCARNAKNA